MLVDAALDRLTDLPNERDTTRRAAIRAAHTTSTGRLLVSQGFRHVAARLRIELAAVETDTKGYAAGAARLAGITHGERLSRRERTSATTCQA
jgi:hypothetical protein